MFTQQELAGIYSAVDSRLLYYDFLAETETDKPEVQEAAQDAAKVLRGVLKKLEKIMEG